MSYVGLSYLMSDRIRYRTRLDGLDTGWVERGPLLRMIDSGAAEPYEFRRGEAPLHAFFRDFHEARARWEGDYAFCRRWEACGGEIWAGPTW